MARGGDPTLAGEILQGIEFARQSRVLYRLGIGTEFWDNRPVTRDLARALDRASPQQVPVGDGIPTHHMRTSTILNCNPIVQCRERRDPRRK